MGSVVSHELLWGKPKFFHRPELERLDPKLLLGSGQLIPVHRISQVGQFPCKSIIA